MVPGGSSWQLTGDIPASISFWKIAPRNKTGMCFREKWRSGIKGCRRRRSPKNCTSQKTKISPWTRFATVKFSIFFKNPDTDKSVSRVADPNPRSVALDPRVREAKKPDSGSWQTPREVWNLNALWSRNLNPESCFTIDPGWKSSDPVPQYCFVKPL